MPINKLVTFPRTRPADFHQLLGAVWTAGLPRLPARLPASLAAATHVDGIGDPSAPSDWPWGFPRACVYSL